MKQVAIDTNVLLRLFVNDDVAQQKSAVNLLESADSVIIPTTVFLECIWVLRRTYRLETGFILEQLRNFIENVPSLVYQENELEAGFAMMEGNGDFADGINEFYGGMMGADIFATFDKKAAKLLNNQGKSVKLLK